MIKRYQVMWKYGGSVSELMINSGLYFTKRGALSQMHELNVIGFHCQSRKIAVVWDRKLNRQCSTVLYLTS